MNAQWLIVRGRMSRTGNFLVCIRDSTEHLISARVHSRVYRSVNFSQQYISKGKFSKMRSGRCIEGNNPHSLGDAKQ